MKNQLLERKKRDVNQIGTVRPNVWLSCRPQGELVVLGSQLISSTKRSLRSVSRPTSWGACKVPQKAHLHGRLKEPNPVPQHLPRGG